MARVLYVGNLLMPRNYLSIHLLRTLHCSKNNNNRVLCCAVLYQIPFVLEHATNHRTAAPTTVEEDVVLQRAAVINLDFYELKNMQLFHGPAFACRTTGNSD